MRITIYTRNDCVQCHATKRAMENRGFDFEMINVDRVPEAAEALRAQGFRQLPVVIAGDLSWSGFRPDMINRLHTRPVHEPARLLLQQLRKHAAFYRTFRSARGAHPAQ